MRSGIRQEGSFEWGSERLMGLSIVCIVAVVVDTLVGAVMVGGLVFVALVPQLDIVVVVHCFFSYCGGGRI
jgi:hypothetical protein